MKNNESKDRRSTEHIEFIENSAEKEVEQKMHSERDRSGSKDGGVKNANPKGSAHAKDLSGEKDRKHSRVHKEKGKTSKKELLDLIQHKNELLQKMEDEIKQLGNDLKNKEDRLLRLAAEFENFRKRNKREWELQKQQANADLIRELLGVLDDFHRAFENRVGEDDHFTSGVRLIFSRLMDILSKYGVEEIDAVGKRFDPRFHEAFGEIDSEEIDEGNIAQVIQRGYLLNGQVLRPARVLIARKRKEPEEHAEDMGK